MACSASFRIFQFPSDILSFPYDQCVSATEHYIVHAVYQIQLFDPLLFLPIEQLKGICIFKKKIGLSKTRFRFSTFSHSSPTTTQNNTNANRDPKHFWLLVPTSSLSTLKIQFCFQVLDSVPTMNLQSPNISARPKDRCQFLISSKFCKKKFNSP